MSIKYIALFLVIGFNIQASQPYCGFNWQSLDGVIKAGAYENAKDYRSQVNQLTQEGLAPFQKAAYWLYHETDPKIKANRSKVVAELMKLGANPLVIKSTLQVKIPVKGTPLEMVGMSANAEDLSEIANHIGNNPNKCKIQAELLYGMRERPEWRRAHRVTWWERLFGAPTKIQELRKAEKSIYNVK